MKSGSIVAQRCFYPRGRQGVTDRSLLVTFEGLITDMEKCYGKNYSIQNPMNVSLAEKMRVAASDGIVARSHDMKSGTAVLGYLSNTRRQLFIVLHSTFLVILCILQQSATVVSWQNLVLVTQPRVRQHVGFPWVGGCPALAGRLRRPFPQRPRSARGRPRAVPAERPFRGWPGS